MKQQWQKFAGRVDALSLRERVLLFAAAATVIVSLAYFTVLGPVFRKELALRAQISQQQNNLDGMNDEIARKIEAYQRDPDAATRARLEAVKNESARLGDSLRAMQKGLVAPERMGPLVDTILRANGRLQLLSMRTLPVSSLNESPAAPAEAKAEPKAGSTNEVATKLAAIKQATEAGAGAAPGANSVAAVAPKPGSLLYRHGVEITVRGQYLDMIDYMNALESLPTQLFWGGARLEVEDYPTARLTLTLYTLSLDSKWLKL
ncbi:type II secretion system protein GspM [Massilia solisilvae]|uniref:Type II secretion system protein GspM n=1 Tax=Massilia solisilvae TaxID=1811225 RepID=A0ABT2BMB7_9BURK|nr:type II secretion system protein GspM [Massilia solisilvae]MCS0609653.1 type II secretion system protein GspM [Massilia solisilvae]